MSEGSVIEQALRHRIDVTGVTQAGETAEEVEGALRILGRRQKTVVGERHMWESGGMLQLPLRLAEPEQVLQVLCSFRWVVPSGVEERL